MHIHKQYANHCGKQKEKPAFRSTFCASLTLDDIGTSTDPACFSSTLISFDQVEWHLTEVRTGHVTLINAVSMPWKGARSTSIFSCPQGIVSSWSSKNLKMRRCRDVTWGKPQGRIRTYCWLLCNRGPVRACRLSMSVRVLFWCGCIFSAGGHHDSLLLCLFHDTQGWREEEHVAPSTLVKHWFITPVFSQTALRRNCGRHRLRRGLGNIVCGWSVLIHIVESCRPCRPDISDHAWTEHIPQEKWITERIWKNLIADCMPNSDMSICQQYQCHSVPKCQSRTHNNML